MPQQSAFKVLIPIVAGIGNALLAVPMIRRLKRHRPDASITILARIDAMAEVFRRLPEIDEVLVTGKGARGILTNIQSSRSRRPDLYLIPFPSNRWQYAMLALTGGAKQKILHGYPIGYWRAMHFVGTRIPAIQGLHDVQQNLNLLKALNIPDLTPEPPIFPLRPEDYSLPQGAKPTPSGLGAPRPLAIHAGSAKTILARAKRWPPDRYAQLIDRLQVEQSHPIILLEGPDEEGVGDEITQHIRSTKPHVIRLRGPLGEAAAILEQSDLYIGSDSGLAHLAAAVGTPAVTIFSAADPDRVCPFGYRHLVVQPPGETPTFLYPWQATAPKLAPDALTNIQKITVDAVMEKVNLALSQQRENAESRA
ncbi:MAG TPA: glycosyltransferase family 9 protein [Tepidisphaeraceae bacterium]